MNVTKRQFKMIHRNARRGDYGVEPNLYEAWGFYARRHKDNSLSYHAQSSSACFGLETVALCGGLRSASKEQRRLCIKLLSDIRSVVYIP